MEKVYSNIDFYHNTSKNQTPKDKMSNLMVNPLLYIKMNSIENCNLDPKNRKLAIISIYQHMNSFVSGQNFGYIALESKNCKRTATVITLEDCDFGILTKDDYQKFGVSEEEVIGNLPNTYLNCGYKVAVVLKEKDDGIHCSLRSKFEFDCSKIAEVFGGGGHKNASGCKIENSLSEAKTLMANAIKEYLKNLPDDDFKKQQRFELFKKMNVNNILSAQKVLNDILSQINC